MNDWITLLRGINVGGNNILPMKDLRALLEALDYTSVKTYIQSGNCLFQTEQSDPAKISEVIANAIEAKFDFRPRVFTLAKEQLDAAIKATPYPGAADAPKSVHFYFLSETPKSPDLDALTALKTETEDFRLTKSVFYLLAPDGIGRSKLAAKAESKLGVNATARNFRTIMKLAELAEA